LRHSMFKLVELFSCRPEKSGALRFERSLNDDSATDPLVVISDACFIHSAFFNTSNGCVVARASFREPILAVSLVEAMCDERDKKSPLMRCLAQEFHDSLLAGGSGFGQAFQKQVLFRIWQLWWNRKNDFTVGFLLETLTRHKWVAGDELSPAWLSNRVLENRLTLDEHFQLDYDPDPRFYLGCNESSFRIGIPSNSARMDGIAAMGRVLLVVGVKIHADYDFDSFYDNVMSTDPALAFLGNPISGKPSASQRHPLLKILDGTEDPADRNAALVPADLRVMDTLKRRQWAEMLRDNR
jgi:hypothetical protein